jgi:hypothetical protein
MTIQQLILQYSELLRAFPNAVRMGPTMVVNSQIKELRHAELKASSTPPVAKKPQRVKPRVK